MTHDIETIVADYETQGYAVAEGVVPHDWCASIVDAAQGFPGAVDARPAAELNVHRRGGIFEQTMAHPVLVTVIDRIVGGEANGLQSQLFFAPPGAPGLYAHQDNHYVEADIACFASAWLALVDTSRANGGLYVYPGSHREGHLPVRTLEGDGFDTRSGVREETVVPAGYEKLDLSVTHGSVVFIHGHVVHGSYPNLSDGRRYALLNTYLRPGSAFRAGRTGGREEHPLLRTLLSPAA